MKPKTAPDPGSGLRGRRSGVGGQGSEVRGQETEVGGQKLTRNVESLNVEPLNGEPKTCERLKNAHLVSRR